MVILSVATVFAVVGVLFVPEFIRAGDLEPSGAPAPTMKTLDEIPPTWSQVLPASERFELVMGEEAVLDKETGLVWARDANLAGENKPWLAAIHYCMDVTINHRKGWRLPTVAELASLVEMSEAGNPKLPTGHPFENVQTTGYWSSVSYNLTSDTYAYYVSIDAGGAGGSNHDGKSNSYSVWPVRGAK